LHEIMLLAGCVVYKMTRTDVVMMAFSAEEVVADATDTAMGDVAIGAEGLPVVQTLLNLKPITGEARAPMLPFHHPPIETAAMEDAIIVDTVHLATVTQPRNHLRSEIHLALVAVVTHMAVVGTMATLNVTLNELLEVEMSP